MCASFARMAILYLVDGTASTTTTVTLKKFTWKSLCARVLEHRLRLDCNNKCDRTKQKTAYENSHHRLFTHDFWSIIDDSITCILAL